MGFNTNVNGLLKDAQSTYRNQLNETKQYVSKWENTGLLEGISADYEKHNTAILLENQARQLISEASSTTAGSDKENWSGVALPLVRRVFAEIAAKEFVSVQPMNLPSGLIFYLDFKYGDTEQGFTAASDIMGNTSASGDPAGGLYGGNAFGYSAKTKTTASAFAAGGNNVFATGSETGAPTWADLGYNTALSASLSAKTIWKATFALAATQAAEVDKEGIKSFVVTSNKTNAITDIYNEYTSINAAGTVITFFGSGNTAVTDADEATITLAYNVQPVANDRGDFEAKPDGTDEGFSGEGDIGIPEINVELKQEPIVAKTRKLKVVWSPEFQQDLNAYHSIDAEAELTSMLSEYVSMEIDLEILSMLSKNALTVDYWSATIGDQIANSSNGGEDAWESVAAPAAYNQGTWFQTLGTKIAKVSNKIHQKTMRGGANFLVTSPDICTILESIPGYGTDSTGGDAQFAMGVSKVGAINNKYTVYKNPYMTSNEIIMGFRGAQFLETGAVYAPYIPLIMTPLVYDPTNFTPRKGVMTRYAKKVVRPEFFGKIYINDLNKI